MLLKCINCSLSTGTGISIFGDVQKPSWHGAEQPALGEAAGAMGQDMETSRSPSQRQPFSESVKKTCIIVKMIISVTVVNEVLKFCPKKKNQWYNLLSTVDVSVYIWSMRKRNCGLCLHFLSLLSCPCFNYSCNFWSLFFFGDRMWFFFSLFRCT